MYTPEYILAKYICSFPGTAVLRSCCETVRDINTLDARQQKTPAGATTPRHYVGKSIMREGVFFLFEARHTRSSRDSNKYHTWRLPNTPPFFFFFNERVSIKRCCSMLRSMVLRYKSVFLFHASHIFCKVQFYTCLKADVHCRAVRRNSYVRAIADPRVFFFLLLIQSLNTGEA